SDIVSLLTLEHQTRFTNLVTRLGWESRLGRDFEATAGELVRYLLFADEVAFTEAVEGGPEFAAAFAKGAVRDRNGRSLRDLDLQHRMFRYRCSYLIYSEQFEALPAPARDRVLRRLHAILTGSEASNLETSERRAILEILRETKASLPGYFRAGPG
ncbi:MAG: hypothetical protein NTW28_28745, partial [Candidatus Solibacter sp.]|nr:hypothetical protein [Candidatus Solibacter sp.]